MAVLPVIVGMGGMNAAGRTSGFHAYKRTVCEVLPGHVMQNTWQDLAYRMGIACPHGVTPDIIARLKAGTLIRRIEAFNPDQMPIAIQATLVQPTHFLIKQTKLPHPLPEGWVVMEEKGDYVQVQVLNSACLLPASRRFPVSCAGGLPSGFNPATRYHALHHPRGLSLAIYGASDALNSMGIPWETILRYIELDEISVYAGSALSQVDEQSWAGLIGEPLRGGRVTSKMMPFSLIDMPADFINSYVLNSLGKTGTQVGACASFLYNLKQGIQDIQSGRSKVVMIGNAEAPIMPAVLEGFHAMQALADDDSLRRLEGGDHFDHRRACRPFSTNTGFTVAEGAQFLILMEDALALALGAPIYGAVADVFVHADGNKKSIAKPGVGNFLSFAKATALAKALLGSEGLQQTFVHAHGTGTPQNRTTESHLINEVAKSFGLQQWPVTAIKAYVGHTMGAAAGDQITSALGTWKYGFIPGITTIDHIADDVEHSHLHILRQAHTGEATKAAFINSKGFGGNNATGLLLSPQQTFTMLRHRYGPDQLQAYEEKHQAVSMAIEEADQAACQGQEKIYYTVGTQVIDDATVSVTPEAVQFSSLGAEIKLSSQHAYEDYSPLSPIF